MGIVKDTLNFSKDIVNDVGNYFSNRRIPTAASPSEEAKKTLQNAPILIEHLQIINALPPIYDNIVDPPIETSADDYQYNLKTLFNKNSYTKSMVGRAYAKNVLASGNYLTLVPMEFDFSVWDAGKGLTDGALVNTIKDNIQNGINRIKGSRANPASLWKSFNEAIDIGSFGYVTKVASKRYWRHVAANMKAVIYALGLEYKVGEGDTGDLVPYSGMSSAMPKWLIDNITSNNFNDRWSLEIDNLELTTGYKDNMSEQDRTQYNNLQNQYEFAKRREAQAAQSYSGSVSGSGTDTSSPYGATRQLIQEQSSKKSSKEIKAEMDAILAKYNTMGDIQEKQKNIAEAQFYEANSIERLRNWVMAVSDSNLIEQNLPFVTFYVNGVIEKNMSASQNVGESELGAILSGNFTMDMLKGLKNKDGSKSGLDLIRNTVSGTAQAGESLVRELSYVGNEATAGYFSSGYVPRVNKGVDGDVSYSINLRSLADGSDPISIAAHCMYTLALITPFYIEPAHKAYKYSFVPKAPLICSAFCKGVFNIPKGCISSIDIKTDPVFQTTESVSTDIEIHLTLVPFINKGFSPDFGTVFNATSDEHHIITAFFNPFSSLNVLITLCGMNTTMTKINEGLFVYFFWKKPTSIVNIAFESWEGFKSSFVDFSSTTIRNLGLAKSVKAI